MSLTKLLARGPPLTNGSIALTLKCCSQQIYPNDISPRNPDVGPQASPTPTQGTSGACKQHHSNPSFNIENWIWGSLLTTVAAAGRAQDALSQKGPWPRLPQSMQWQWVWWQVGKVGSEMQPQASLCPAGTHRWPQLNHWSDPSWAKVSVHSPEEMAHPWDKRLDIWLKGKYKRVDRAERMATSGSVWPSLPRTEQKGCSCSGPWFPHL